MTNRAPKQWCLTKVETVKSYENWRQNLLYTLSLDPNYLPYLEDGANWGKKTRANVPHWNFVDDDENVPEANRKTRAQKIRTLELMLGQIANYTPIISRSTIVNNSTTLRDIWQIIRLHYGFQSIGAHFLDFTNIQLQPNERPEDLFPRLMAFTEDNLLKTELGITHNGQEVQEDEELTPALENFIVLTWLTLIRPYLPRLVKQRYGAE